MTLIPWLNAIRVYIYAIDGDFQMLLECGYVSYKGKLVVYNAADAAAIERSLFSTDPPENPHSWRNPFPPSAPSKSTLSDTSMQQYALGHHTLVKLSKRLALLILQGIDVGPERDDFERDCKGCGIALLQILFAEAAKIGAMETTTIQQRMHERWQMGLNGITVKDFNSFRAGYEGLNNCLSDEDRYTPTKLRRHYIQLVGRSGAVLEQNLKMALLEFQDASADQNSLTLSCIRKVIGNQATRDAAE